MTRILMKRILARLRSRGLGRGLRHAWAGAGRFERGDAALDRLHAAREHFDDSVVALRKAALDHVDVQDLASTAIRANLDRLALSLGRDFGGALGSDAVGDA